MPFPHPPHPDLLQAQQALAHTIAKLVGRPSTVSLSAPSHHPTTTYSFNGMILMSIKMEKLSFATK